jgi:hypothetical protein
VVYSYRFTYLTSVYSLHKILQFSNVSMHSLPNLTCRGGQSWRNCSQEINDRLFIQIEIFSHSIQFSLFCSRNPYLAIIL